MPSIASLPLLSNSSIFHSRMPSYVACSRNWTLNSCLRQLSKAQSTLCSLNSLTLHRLHLVLVTVYGKTRHMGFSMKIEFDAYLISSTIELTRVQVSDRSRASLWSYSAFFAIAPHPQQSRNYGLKALLCTRMAFPYTTRIPEVN